MTKKVVGVAGYEDMLVLEFQALLHVRHVLGLVEQLGCSYSIVQMHQLHRRLLVTNGTKCPIDKNIAFANTSGLKLSLSLRTEQCSEFVANCLCVELCL